MRLSRDEMDTEQSLDALTQTLHQPQSFNTAWRKSQTSRSITRGGWTIWNENSLSERCDSAMIWEDLRSFAPPDGRGGCLYITSGRGRPSLLSAFDLT
jgi:hypothetical protein